MDRVQQVAAAAVLLAAVGCTTPSEMTESITRTARKANPFADPSPTTQVVSVWQRTLARLPDPARGGVLAPGMAGQLFLISAESTASDVRGDVTVAVYDETPRAPGAKPHDAEVFHFTADTLKKLAANDERFGRNYVLFLPWPPGWDDVTAVRVLTRYDAPGQPPLHAGEVKMALDLTGGGAVWTDNGKPTAAGSAAVHVPDGAKVLEQVRATAAGQPQVIPAGGLSAP